MTARNGAQDKPELSRMQQGSCAHIDLSVSQLYAHTHTHTHTHTTPPPPPPPPLPPLNRN